MLTDLSQFHAVFFDEARELLDEMERLLLILDVNAPDSDDLNAVFRAAHSIKGGSGTFGFADMAEVTHELESLLDMVRNGERPLTNEIIDASLTAADVINKQLQGHREGHDVDPAEGDAIIRMLQTLIGTTPAATVLASPPPASPPTHHYQIDYTPRDSAQSLEPLQNELQRLGELTYHEMASGQHQFLLSSSAPPSELEEIFSFIASPDEFTITQATEAVAAPLEGDGFGFFTDPATLKADIENEQGYGFFEDLPSPAPDPVPAPNAPQPTETTDTPKRRAADREAETSIRVSVEKVDQLINLVGELVITHAMLAQTVSLLDPVQNERLFNGMAQLERNSRDLQEAVMSVRMLPIGFVFNRFPRMVRELAGKFGKQVELKLVGENTELDKGLIEKLADPLTHLVRNSLDHGIEMPDTRLEAGKPPRGTLTLQAYHQGGSIVVEVKDDGGGLNRARILAKAQERGIPISPEAPDHEVWQLIFAPGFSTAEAITDVSGRGVGMDIVKRNIESMGGRIDLESKAGQGTRITIRLPLTLAILDGMSIGVGEQTYILPLNMIVESLQPQPAEISTISERGQVVHVRGEYLPLVALHQVFGIQPHTTDPCQGIVVILEVEGGKAALLVDQLLGQHQVVIKSLETNYRKVRGVSGATIMGDGRVAMILDVPALIQLSRS